MKARDLTDAQRAEIRKLKAEGTTSAAIGLKFRISSDTVRRIAKQSPDGGASVLPGDPRSAHISARSVEVPS